MEKETKQKIQLALIAAMVLSAARAGYILYQRHEDKLAQEKQIQAKNAGYSNPDFYVTPKRLHPYDLKSAKELVKQPVWVKEGYRYTYYPYQQGHVDFAREAGLLLPIEKLEIKDVVLAAAPGGNKQVAAVFQKEGKSFAVPIGIVADDQYKIYSDEIFYIEDPHQLYKHWSADVWQAIENHEVKPGMNELQADFAVGMGTPDSGASDQAKTVRYANGGKPLVVEYRSGRAVEVRLLPEAQSTEFTVYPTLDGVMHPELTVTCSG